MRLLLVYLLLLIAILSTCDSRAPARETPTASATPSEEPTVLRTTTPTITPIPTPEPIAYRVTWYGDEFAGGPMLCTGEPFDPNDPTVAARGEGGPPCGTHLRLCSDAACIEVVISDGCGGCGPEHLDLSRAGWHALGQPYEVTATPVPLVSESDTPPPAPTPVPGGNLAALALPDGTSVNTSGCARDGNCWGYNAFWWPTKEVVMIPGEPYYKEVHERCHAHQAWSIGRDLTPSEYDLHPWYATVEGQSFMAAVGVPDPWPWTHSAINGLEAFAWTCAYWYTAPGHLIETSPGGYQWAQQNLP